MKEMIKHVARYLVDNPDEISVTEITGNNTTVFELSVGKDDLGKIIGKQGRTAQALRTLLSAVSAKQKKRAVLEIID